MAKGSVRKKGRKWYYRFYIKDENGKIIQKEYVGSTSKRETEQLLRKAIDDYESGRLLPSNVNITFREMTDIWVNEELKRGALSNGTVMAYQGVINCINKDPIADMKLKRITSDILQKYMDKLVFGEEQNDGTVKGKLSKGYLSIFCAVLRNIFKFAVFPKKYISSDPMQYVTIHKLKEKADLFPENPDDKNKLPVITHEQYLKITEFLHMKNNAAELPVQIAYYTGLRLGEVCALTWQDIDLEEQYLIVRRSMRYNSIRYRVEIGSAKRSKIRTIDFCDTLAEILKNAKQNYLKIPDQDVYYRNFYRKITEKGREYFELHSFKNDEKIPDEFKEISLVCVRKNGKPELPDTISIMCRSVRKQIEGLEDFHFHTLRHTYTSNLLSAGAAPKEVQELLGHSDINTTMNIYAHSSREKRQNSAKLLDKMEVSVI